MYYLHSHCRAYGCQSSSAQPSSASAVGSLSSPLRLLWLLWSHSLAEGCWGSQRCGVCWQATCPSGQPRRCYPSCWSSLDPVERRGSGDDGTIQASILDTRYSHVQNVFYFQLDPVGFLCLTTIILQRCFTLRALHCWSTDYSVCKVKILVTAQVDVSKCRLSLTIRPQIQTELVKS